MSPTELFAIYIKYFVILTPFFVLAVFITITENEEPATKRALALRVTMGVALLSAVLFLFGDVIFSILGITLDAFRIGAGALLFLSAVSLVEGKINLPNPKTSLMDMAIVPLSIPITIGPGSVGALIVMGSETHGAQAIALTLLAITAASVSVGILLLMGHQIRRLIGRSGIAMLSKITGLVLASLSCQMIFQGVAAFLKG